MNGYQTVPALLAPLVILATLLAGAYAVAVIDGAVGAWMSGRRPRAVLAAPLRQAARLLVQDGPTTERPDLLLWILGVAGYAALAAAALSVVPLVDGWVVADVRTGIVVFGAAEALALVTVFLHGWSANSMLGLIGGYRFVAMALSYELVSMFVLIAAALPAESLSVTAIVASQGDLWNVVRQPLGLPLWLVVTLGVSFWGPMNLADGQDLSGGTAAEVSGPARLMWETARRAMLFVFCAMGAAVFFGGPSGPGLPGGLWMLIWTLALVVATCAVGHAVGRARSERVVLLLWTVLLPLSFLDLAWAGAEALL